MNWLEVKSHLVILMSAANLFNTIVNRSNNLHNTKYNYGNIVRLGLWLRHLSSIVRALVPKVMECYSVAASIYAGWSIDTDIHYETATKYSIMNSSPRDVH